MVLFFVWPDHARPAAERAGQAIYWPGPACTNPNCRCGFLQDGDFEQPPWGSRWDSSEKILLAEVSSQSLRIVSLDRVHLSRKQRSLVNATSTVQYQFTEKPYGSTGLEHWKNNTGSVSAVCNPAWWWQDAVLASSASDNLVSRI